jgi:DNA-binding MarR family transcriptional regulator
VRGGLPKRRGVPLSPAAHRILAELNRHEKRTTHELAEAIGRSAYLTTSFCHGLMRAGHIWRQSKGKPGKGGHPAIWTKP